MTTTTTTTRMGSEKQLTAAIWACAAAVVITAAMSIVLGLMGTPVAAAGLSPLVAINIMMLATNWQKRDEVRKAA